MDEREICIEYYLDPSNPRVFDGVPDDLRNNIIEQYNDEAFPFNHYREYQNSVQEELTSTYDPLTNLESLLHDIDLPHDSLRPEEVTSIHSKIITNSIQEYERLVTQQRNDGVPKYRVKNLLNRQQRELWLSHTQVQSIIDRIYDTADSLSMWHSSNNE